VEGVAHITGGGLIENLPRMFGDDLQAQVDSSAWPSLPVFDYLKELGGLSDDDCWQTFNMGLGMILAVQPDLVDQVKSRLNQAGEACYQVGQLVNRPAGEEKIVIK
ncbi:MAG: AIR synthase-related protein, partial [Limosilactobacillus fermentum]